MKTSNTTYHKPESLKYNDGQIAGLVILMMFFAGIFFALLYYYWLVINTSYKI